MKSKYIKYITENVFSNIKTKTESRHKAVSNLQLSKFIVEQSNNILPLQFNGIYAKDIKPFDLLVTSSGKMLKVNLVEEKQDGQLEINFSDLNGCELIESHNQEDLFGFVDTLEESENVENGEKVELYEGEKKKVKLNKIMRGDVKKYKVYVKNDKGNVVKVNFGDPNMEIKRDDPARRKNFRARHNCENPGPRWKARYWACKTWSSKPVSAMLKESVEETAIPKELVWKAVSNNIANKVTETLNEAVYNPDLFGLIKNRTK